MSETLSPKAAKTSRPSGLNQKDTTLFWCGISLVLHVVLMLATSIGFINDTWVDPEGAAARKAAAEAAAKPPAATQPAATAPTAAPAAGTQTPAATPVKETAKPEDPAAARKETAIMKNTTEAAKPSEIPKVPDDLGLNMDDINAPAKKK
jgi:hypothetical protein